MNPILERITRAKQSAANQPMDIKSMIRANGIENTANILMQTSPEFRQFANDFVKKNKGKSAKRIAEEYNISNQDIENLIK